MTTQHADATSQTRNRPDFQFMFEAFHAAGRAACTLAILPNFKFRSIRPWSPPGFDAEKVAAPTGAQQTPAPDLGFHNKSISYVLHMAERWGFEPPIGLRLCRISSAVLSTAQPPLRGVYQTRRRYHGGASPYKRGPQTMARYTGAVAAFRLSGCGMRTML